MRIPVHWKVLCSFSLAPSCPYAATVSSRRGEKTTSVFSREESEIQERHTAVSGSQSSSRTVSSGRQKTRTSVVRLPPLAGRSCTTFSFTFSALTYLSASICLIDYFCASVVDGGPPRPPRPGRRLGSPSRPRTRRLRALLACCRISLS